MMKLQSESQLNIRPLLTPKDVSETLGITSGTLQIWRTTCRYDLPYIKVGGKVMYRPEDIQDFIKRRTMTHTY